MTAHWEHYPHGADIGVRGIGLSLEEAFAQAARAVTAAAIDPDAVRAETAAPIHCSGSDHEDLLYAWLNAVIYEMATRRMLFTRFDVTLRGSTLDALAWGEPISPERHEPAVEIKGATYTTLHVRRDGEQWVAECVIDV